MEAIVERVVPLGSEVRVELALGDGAPLTIHLGRMDAEMLELRVGEIVYARPTRATAQPPVGV